MALFAIVLLGVLVTGSVVAATGGYVLWEGTSEIMVSEPITIYYGSSTGSCNAELVLDDPLGATVGMTPGVCIDTWFRITNDVPYDLLIKVDVTTSDDTVVTAAFFDESGNPSDIESAGLLISYGDGAVFVYRSVCVNGTAALGLYTVSTAFTRDSSTS